MTNPYLDLYYCIINVICGMFFFIIYYGILLIEQKRKNYTIYIIDFFTTLTLGYIYLLILISNKIYFHIYFIIFISIGYLISYKFFKKQLLISYTYFFVIIIYLYNKIRIIIEWSFDIIPIKLLINFTKKKIFRYKVKRAIKKINVKIQKKRENHQ